MGCFVFVLFFFFREKKKNCFKFCPFKFGVRRKLPPKAYLLKAILNDHSDTPSQKLTCSKASLAFLFECSVSKHMLPALVKLLSTSYVHQ